MIQIFGSILSFLGFIIFIWLTLVFRSKPYRAFWLILQDLRKKKSDAYPEFGVWLFTGLGGVGKTISAVEYAYRMKKKYPKLWIVSNLKSLTFGDGLIKEWNDLIDIRNPNGDEYGVLFLFDEIQLTLASHKWQKAPENLLEYVSQQRKMYKHIIGGSQVFERVNIRLREQTNYVVEISNFGKRWIFMSAFNKETYGVNGERKDEGMRKRSRAWRYNFVATDELRKMYDTYEIQVDLYEKEESKGATII